MEDNQKQMRKIRAEILERLIGVSSVNTLLLNGRSGLVKKNSRLNGLINIINTIYETEDIDKLTHILEEIGDLEKEGKLDEIRGIDIEEEVRQEYTDEYNYTSTRYDKLSDEELSKIDGIECFYHNGNRVIVLNGAPFRFLGRAISGNNGNVLTDPNATYSMNSSLISNLRPNRWRKSEFDILEGTMTPESFVAFGAADAHTTISDSMVSPEILQRFVSSYGGSGFHTHVDLKGIKTASATLLELDSKLDLDDNPEYRPYGTIYIYNPSPYIAQAEKRDSYLGEMLVEEAIKHFGETADSEFFLDVITSATPHYESDGSVYPGYTEKGKEILSKINEMVDFSKCDNIENLRYISSIIDLARDLDTPTGYFNNIKRMCEIRIRNLSKARPFSLRDEIEKCSVELQTRREIEPLDIMRDFISSESKKSKEKGWFVRGESVEDELKRREELNKETQMKVGQKLKDKANGIKSEDQRIGMIYRTLKLGDNPDNIFEIVNSINDLAQKVLELKKIKQVYSTELLELVSGINIEDIFKYKNALLENEIGNKIKSLIEEANLQDVENNIQLLAQGKKGLFDRFTGRDKYSEALMNNLKAQKKLIRSGNGFDGQASIKALIEYAESNGMTSNIMGFLVGYQECGLELSDEEKSRIAELCKKGTKEMTTKNTSLIKKMSRKEYKLSASMLDEETEEIIRQSEGIPNDTYSFFKDRNKINLAGKINTAIKQLAKIDEEFSKKMHLEKSVSRESDEREEW